MPAATFPPLRPRYDFLIVGAGLFGATFARVASERGYSCLVVEKRPNTGGNIRCEEVDGINVHLFGAHIFHTSNSRVWEFVNRFTTFNRFTNSPLANCGGRLYNLPFNMNTFHQLWGVTTPGEAQAKIEADRREAIEEVNATHGGTAPNLELSALTMVGRDIYEKLIKGYTEKQWGRKCSELPAFIIRRLPLRFTFDNNYFTDLHQGIPMGGYNPLIDRLLEGSDVVCDCDFFQHRARLSSLAGQVVFTGPVDQFFDYRFGPLHYRSLRFETETLAQPNFQGVAVVNYTQSTPAWTRIIEHKHFEAFGEAVYSNPKTVITREYPMEWQPGDEPFYPVNDSRNTALYERYAALAEELPNVHFGGRLAQYRYFDMAPTIAEALALADRLAPVRQ